MRNKNYLKIFFFITWSSYVGGSQTLVYKPKTYHGLESINNQTLYPGDKVIITIRTIVETKDGKTPVEKSVFFVEAPNMDMRYFWGIQSAVAVTYEPKFASNKKALQCMVTYEYTVKNCMQPESVTLYKYQATNTNPSIIFVSSTPDGIMSNNSLQLLDATYQQIVFKIMPSLVGAIPSPVTPFEKTDGVKTEADVIYPGDVFRIKKISSFYKGKSLRSYDYIYFSSRDYFESYENYDMAGGVNSGGEEGLNTYQYFKVKDDVKIAQKMVIPYTIFRFNIIPQYNYEKDGRIYYFGQWDNNKRSHAVYYRAGYLTMPSISSITLSPFPDFFKMTDNEPDLRKILRAYLSTPKGCTANAVDSNNRTPLMWSIFYGHEELVRYFLNEKDVSLNSVDNDGRNALMYAAQRNNQAIADLLLSKSDASLGIPVQDKDGMTMLHYSVWNNNYSIAQSILTTKTLKKVIDIGNKWKISPLMYACAQGNKKITQLLLDNKADYTLVDSNGFNCLTYACMSLNSDFVNYLYSVLLSQDKTTALKLLQSVAIDQTNLIYNTLLIGESDDDFFEIIQFLIKQGCSIESDCDVTKNKLLQSYLQAPQMVRGAYGSLLELACSKGPGATKTIQALLYSGAKITPAVITVAQKNSVLDVIKSYSDQAGPLLYQALYEGDTATALQIVQQFSEKVPYARLVANYTNSERSVLFLLVTQAQGNDTQGYNAVAQELIKRGASVNVVGPDAQGNPVTPIVLAVNNGNTQLQKILQNSGSHLSHTVANTITLTSNAAYPTDVTPNNKPSQTSSLVSGKTAPINTAAVSQVVDNYDSIEYLLG